MHKELKKFLERGLYPIPSDPLEYAKGDLEMTPRIFAAGGGTKIVSTPMILVGFKFRDIKLVTVLPFLAIVIAALIL